MSNHSKLAESEGFEPPVALLRRRLSKTVV